MFLSLLFHLLQCLFRIGRRQGQPNHQSRKEPHDRNPINQQIREIQDELVRDPAEEEAMIRAKFGNPSVKRNVYAYALELQ